MIWRRADARDRGIAWLGFACSVSAIVLAPILPRIAMGFPGCPWRTWTGWPCPTCGATRGLLALVRLHWLEAIDFNPLVTLTVLMSVVAGLAAPAWIALRGPLPIAPTPWPLRWRVLVGTAIAANWGWLVLQGR